MPQEKGVELRTDEEDRWSVHRGDSPIVGTAIHNGHEVREALARRMAIDPQERRREEDPFTEYAIRDVPNRIVFHRSRFAVDLNRARDSAVYLSAEQSWGLDVWEEKPTPEMVEHSLALHDGYYAMLETMLRELETLHGRFVVLDVHSYNHRRDGPDAPPADPDEKPEINIGTFSMDRERWAPIVEPFIEALRAFDFRGRHLDVRENVAFEGKGEQTRFIHERFPESGCAIAIEFKKFFMDEWTGRPAEADLEAMRAMLAATLPVLEERLGASGTA